MNRRIKGAYEDYLKSEMTSIHQAYSKPSARKVDAWYGKCYDLRRDFNGRDLKVVRKNCNFFSAGFVFTNGIDGKDYFCWIRPNDSEIAKIN